jgi:hypothetical protein
MTGPLSSTAVLIIACGILLFWIAWLLWHSRRIANKFVGNERFKIKLFVSYGFARPGTWHTFSIYALTINDAVETAAKKIGLDEWTMGQIIDQGDKAFIVNIFVWND